MGNKGVEPIALIGMGCRLPGGIANPGDFWRLLCEGVDPISEVPADRWNLQTIFDVDRTRKGKAYVRQAGFLSGFDAFDATFFGISPREAECMDPQQRWLLECAWEAFEDAGIAPESLSGSRTGVFVGLFVRDFETLQLSSVNRDLIDAHTGVGTSMGIAANRISYVYNLTGPSMTIDTACSSAMVALHLACQSIRNGECTVALAGGVNALLRAEMTVATSKASMLSPDARSKSFDAAANGYVRSEGVGLVVLKSLSQALADGDPIVAVIRGSAVNQDGRSKGLTVPSGEAQTIALRAALAASGVDAHEVQYAEAHGTGTPVGDPIESTALGTVLGTGRTADRPLIMGSVKSNIGHTESAAGVVSLIKVALSLKHGVIPPNLHFRNPNPAIPFEALNLRVPAEMTPWPETDGGPRRAVINSFGFGGTNGSMVVEEAPAVAREVAAVSTDRAMLLPVSGKTPEALRAAIERLREFQAKAPAPVADLCYSASQRRGHLPHRAAAVVDTLESVAAAMDALLQEDPRAGVSTGEAGDAAPTVAFVFSGMGPQWWAMGRQLLAEEPVFRAQVEAVDAEFQRVSGWSILAELGADESNSRIQETRIAQPAIFAVQVGLAALWKSWGVVPSAIAGHSVGEAAAAYVAGALTLAEAARVIFHRSRLQQTTAGTGTMLAVGLARDAAEVEISRVADLVSIAAVNGPRSMTLAGDSAALRSISTRLAERGEFQRFLQVEVPYHSPGMDPIEAELVASLAGIQPRETVIPLYSTVTGALIDGRTLDANYWWKNVRYPVLFADAMEAMGTQGHHCILELSPHPVLARSIDECLRGRVAELNVVSSLRRGEPERASLLASAGALYCAGYPLQWAAINQGRFVRLPDYPWQRERYWMETEESAAQRVGNGVAAYRGMALGAAEHPLLGSRLNLAPALRGWEAEIDLGQLTYLKDHCIQSAVVYPGAAYAEMAMAAAHVRSIENLTFHSALLLGDGAARVQFSLTGTEFQIHSEREGNWALHATGNAAGTADGGAATKPAFTAAVELERPTVYEQFASLGLRYGPAFQAIERLAISEDGVRSVLGETVNDEGYILHPTILDATFQTLIGTVLGDHQAGVFLPTQIGQISIVSPIAAGAQLECFARLTSRTTSEISGDIELFQGERCVLTVRRLQCRFQAAPRQAGVYDSMLYRHQWEAQDLPAQPASLAGAWLIVGDPQGAGAALADELRHAGAKVRLVFDSLIDTQADVFSALRGGATVDHVVLLSGIGMPVTGQRLGCHRLLELVQASEGQAPKVWIVTQGAQSTSGEVVAAEQAAIWGMARVVMQEHPELRCTCIDLAPGAVTAATLFDELRFSSDESQIALRDGARYVLRLARYSPEATSTKAAVLPDATYLITGGTGGLGIVFARHLLARGARHIVLTSRSGGTGKEAVLEELRRGGADVRAVAADIGARAEVQRLLRMINDEMPPLRGILHAAAVIDDGVLRKQSIERFENVWRPKALGAWWLDHELGGRELDFFVLFSSVASLTGSAGQGIYSAANAFLDGLAHRRRARGLTALSINWGPWAEVGAAMQGDVLAHLAERGLEGLKPSDCLDAFDELAGLEAAQVGVCDFRWPKFFEKFPGASAPFYASMSPTPVAGQPVAVRFLDQLMALDGEEREPALRRFLQEELARALRLPSPDRIKPRQRFFDLGMDSLTSVELGGRIQAGLGIRLPSTVMFDFPTVQSLGNFLVDSVLGAPVVASVPVELPAVVVTPDLTRGDGEVQEDLADLLRMELAAGHEGKF